MARRAGAAPPTGSASLFQPGYGQSARRIDPNESAFQRFLREQIFAPQYIPGHINILAGVGLFTAGIVFFRKWGDVLVFA